MKRLALLVGIMVFAFYNIAFCEEVGRYQLFQGEYKFVNVKGEQYWEKALLKIDTATGQVWMGEE